MWKESVKVYNKLLTGNQHESSTWEIFVFEEEGAYWLLKLIVLTVAKWVAQNDVKNLGLDF